MPTLEAKTSRLLVLPTDLFIEYQIDLARVNSRQPGVYGSRRIGLARRPRQSVVVAVTQGGARVRWQVSHGSELRFCSGPYLGVGCPVIIPVLGPHDGLLATKDSSSVNRALSAKLSAPASLSKPTLTLSSQHQYGLGEGCDFCWRGQQLSKRARVSTGDTKNCRNLLAAHGRSAVH